MHRRLTKGRSRKDVREQDCTGKMVRVLLQGINQHRRLPEPLSVDPDTLEESERRQRGIILLSANLREALDAWKCDQGEHS